MLSVGLFAAHDPLENTTQGRDGLFHGGGMYLLGVQTLACCVIISWSAVVSAMLLLVMLAVIIPDYVSLAIEANINLCCMWQRVVLIKYIYFLFRFIDSSK
jgi:Amt family ammonium transporter